MAARLIKAFDNQINCNFIFTSDNKPRGYSEIICQPCLNKSIKQLLTSFVIIY